MKLAGALGAWILAGLLAAPLLAAEHGRIEGRVARPDGLGLAGVTASLTGGGISRTALTDAEGRYAFDRVPAGTYSVELRLGDSTARETVTVEAGTAAQMDSTVDWEPSFAETLVVEAASRQAERIVEAPSAVTVLEAGDIARSAAQDQLPRLLAGTPGVDLVQNGLYDWSLNVRGFNRPINRRILILVDGRDPSLPIFAGGQEWGALGLSMDDLAKIELVRGPGAALYGANAFNGVLSLITKTPREFQGGRLRATFGELDTQRVDGHWAGEATEDLWVKLTGSYQESDDFTRPRVGQVEYEPLPREALLPPQDRVRVTWGSLRVDREFGGGRRLLTFGAGQMSNEGIVILTDIGRTQRTDVKGPWARCELSSPHWRLLGTYTGRDSDREVSLASGYEIYLDESRVTGDLEGRTEFSRGRGRLIGGASFSRLRDDTANPAGQQTLYARAQSADQTALFGQAGYQLSDKLEVVASLRGDRSDLHDDRFSPRAALVYAFNPNHSLRLSWSSAFQSPALAEYYLSLPVAQPLDLSFIEAQLAPVLGGARLGLDSVPLLAVGNPGIKVEEVESLEAGYSAILGQHVWLTANVYRNRLKDFTTPLLPTAGTSLGLFLGDSFQSYRPPAGLSAAASNAVLAVLAAALPPPLLAVLSQREDGSTFIPLLSYSNFGRVETHGLELGVNADFTPWRLDLSYTYFDFEIREKVAENPLAPNAPRSQIGFGISSRRGRFDGALRARWAEGFDWRSGVFAGRVPQHTVVDLALGARLGGRWRAGVDVTNLLDEDHFEVFGGDRLGRRALAHLAYEW